MTFPNLTSSLQEPVPKPDDVKPPRLHRRTLAARAVVPVGEPELVD